MTQSRGHILRPWAHHAPAIIHTALEWKVSSKDAACPRDAPSCCAVEASSTLRERQCGSIEIWIRACRRVQTHDLILRCETRLCFPHISTRRVASETAAATKSFASATQPPGHFQRQYSHVTLSFKPQSAMAPGRSAEDRDFIFPRSEARWNPHLLPIHADKRRQGRETSILR